MRSLSPSLIFVCTRTVSPTRNSGTCPRTSGLTFRCSTSSIAFARIFVSSSDYRSPKFKIPSSLLPCEQIGAPLACARHRLVQSPPRDLLVVPREQDLRHPQSAELGRAGVLRSFQQALAGEALGLCGKLVAQHTGDQPGHGVDDRQGRDLSAGEDEVAQRELLVHPAQHPLVHPFVAPAHQDQRSVVRQLLRLALVESRALGGEKHHSRPRPTLAGGLDGPYGGGAVLAVRELP